MDNGWRGAEERALSGKFETVFVDFYDTIAFRKCLSEKAALRARWGRSTLWKYFFYQLARRSVLTLTKRELNSSFIGRQIVKRMRNIFIADLDDLYIPDQVINCLNSLRADGLKVYVFTNTTLTKNDIALKIRQSRLAVDDIYTSSNVGLIKSQGLLKVVLLKLNLQPSRVLIIGDDYDEDIKPSMEVGVSTFQIKSPSKMLSSVISKRQLSLLAKKHVNLNFVEELVLLILNGSIIEPWEAVGFLYSYPLACILAHALKSKTGGAKKILFLSREGYFPRRVMMSMVEGSDTHLLYLYVSRILLDSMEGRAFISNQLREMKLGDEAIAIFDIGWRGKSFASVREIGNLNAAGYFMFLWPWVASPAKSITLIGSRHNVLQALRIRRCPEIYEFLLSAPHQSMRSAIVEGQPAESAEHQICLGFEKALSQASMRLHPQFPFKFFDALIKNPSFEQSHFFGGITHSVKGEREIPLISPSRVLWLRGAKASRVIGNKEVLLEFIRRIKSGVRSLVHDS